MSQGHVTIVSKRSATGPHGEEYEFRVELDDTNPPGMILWNSGATRQAMQDANRAASLPCYCASLWSGWCDFCSGLAPKGGDRWTGQLQEQREAVTA